jgi:hypothetical protein
MSYRILHAQNKETATLWGPVLGSQEGASRGRAPIPSVQLVTQTVRHAFQGIPKEMQHVADFKSSFYRNII